MRLLIASQFLSTPTVTQRKFHDLAAAASGSAGVNSMMHRPTSNSHAFSEMRKRKKATERNLRRNPQNPNPVHRGAFLKLIRWSIRTVSSNAGSGSFITFAPTGYCTCFAERAVDEGAESKFLRK